jgi:O-acetylhomoserine (thiol)-lyase
MTTNSQNPETIGLHGGTFRRDESQTSVAVPIHQTTSYQFNSAEHAGNLFGLKEFGNIYTRIMNPTTNVLEERVAALEGGVAGLCVSSGQAASAFTVQNLCNAGDNIVASTDLYGGTVNLFNNTLKQMGIEVRYADPVDPKNFEKLSDDKTRAYYAETLPNPSLRVFPISEVAEIGKNKGIPLIMDNTACPVICKPIEHGASIVMHSLTKFIGGHGTSIGGIIVDSGKFDWAKNKKRHPNIWEPDPSYHGAVWGDAVPQLTGANIPYIIRARVVLLRDLGSAISPFNAFQIIQGLETVTLRMKQHCSNAEKVKEYLSKHGKVQKVIYSTLHQGEVGQRAKKYFKGGNGALIGFELKGGLEAGKKFIDNLKMLYHVANIGDARSLAIHPASTTHSQLSEKDQLAAGVTPGYVRLSIGIEHPDDIIADIDQALSA